MHVQCQHCHQPLELGDNADLQRIDCPSCGRAFSRSSDATAGHEPERLDEAITNPAEAKTIGRGS